MNKGENKQNKKEFFWSKKMIDKLKDVRRFSTYNVLYIVLMEVY